MKYVKNIYILKIGHTQLYSPLKQYKIEKKLTTNQILDAFNFSKF